VSHSGNHTKTVVLPPPGIFLLSFVFLISNFQSAAQNCPPNIDFESGSFDGWTCYTGSVSAGSGDNVISLFNSNGPVFDQHTLYSAANDGGVTDYFGDFPVVCPNGSGYSVKLGNTTGGAQAEGISYQFTIPDNRNTFSLIYHYAVVFQDPNHLPYQQPRLVLEVSNRTDNKLIDCSSFTFFPNGSPLPGFFQSSRSDSIAVWCKDWSAVTINLNGMAGKTIELFFKTADCTFRRHFGYAYIDVNTECSSEFTGATYCADDTAVLVTAPYGYQGYTWFNNTFTQTLGNQQTLSFMPPPPSGTVLAVELIPYDGYGCKDTLYANMIDTLTLRANAGLDQVSCNGEPVLIGTIASPGVKYSWSPSAGLSNSFISNPRAAPNITTTYTLTVRSSGGGCVNSDDVIVKTSFVDSTLALAGKTLFCVNTGDSAVLSVPPAASIQWYRDGRVINGANQARYRVNQTGTYYASVTNADGCNISTRPQMVTIESPRPGINYPLQYALVNMPVLLGARSFGVSWLWKPSIYLDSPAITTPLFTSPFLQDQVYTIDITTAAGCLTVDTQKVAVIKEVKVYVATGFTPNNDGLNDWFVPVMIGIRDFDYFRVYHRNGQLVYDMKQNNRGWDGGIRGTPQSSGVYVWVFSGTGLDNRKHFQKGTVVLIR
jgi:gliding motility-associated-like protein